MQLILARRALASFLIPVDTRGVAYTLKHLRRQAPIQHSLQLLLRVVLAFMLADPAGNVQVLVLAQLLVVELVLVVPVQVVTCQSRHLVVATADTLIHISARQTFTECLLVLLKVLLVDDLRRLNQLLLLHLGLCLR